MDLPESLLTRERILRNLEIRKTALPESLVTRERILRNLETFYLLKSQVGQGD